MAYMHCLRPMANSHLWKVVVREPEGLRTATDNLRSITTGKSTKVWALHYSSTYHNNERFQLSQLMRENSESGSLKRVYSHWELPDFTTLPEDDWRQSTAVQLATNKHEAYWRFPLFVIVIRQMSGFSWKGHWQGQSSPITKPVS
jgi:hypothetical protein